MNVKFLLVLLVPSILTVNGALIDEAKILLVELQELVQGSYDSAVLKLRGHEQEMQDLSGTLLDVGAAQIQAEYANLILKLDAIKQSAEDAALDITACLEQYQKEFDDLLPLMGVYLTECVDYRGNQVSHVVVRAIQNLDTTLERVEELETALDRCGSDQLCIAGIIGEIASDQTELPAKVIRIVDTAMEYITVTMDMLAACAVEQINRLSDRGGTTLANIQTCVDGLNQ